MLHHSFMVTDGSEMNSSKLLNSLGINFFKSTVIQVPGSNLKLPLKIVKGLGI